MRDLDNRLASLPTFRPEAEIRKTPPFVDVHLSPLLGETRGLSSLLPSRSWEGSLPQLCSNPLAQPPPARGKGQESKPAQFAAINTTQKAAHASAQAAFSV